MCYAFGMNSNHAETQPTCPKGSLLREDRAIHLLDVENLCGTPAFGGSDISRLRARYEELVPIGPRDHVVVAASHFRAKELLFGWTEARPLFRSGPDGADLCLLDVVFHEGIEGRYSKVVIGSGDGIFSPVYEYLETHGPSVTVVARTPRSVSAAIHNVARDIRYLDPTTDTVPGERR
jgi:hypothetical protein